MSAKHTPGPWRLSDGMIQCRSHWHDSVGSYFDWEYPRILATVTDDWDQDVNGNLIAAAPDLARALADLLADALSMGLDDSPVSGSLIEARNALRKAGVL